MTLNFLKHVPVSTDPCGRLQYGIPNNSTEHQGLAKVDYTISANQSMFARYFYAVYDNPATYDGSNVLTLSRTGQNNQAHSLVVGHNLVLSSSTLNSLHVTFNRTLNDRPLPPYFSATDLGSRVFSLVPGYVGVSVTGNGFAVGSGATNPGYFNSKGWQIADDLDIDSRRPPVLDRRQLDSLAHRDAQQPADQRRVHVQRPDDRVSRSPTSWWAA